MMLEKIARVCLVEKLHAIQLYEVDFNYYNSFIFGRQAMQTLTDRGYCRKPPSYVPYKGTYVPYDGTFGTPDQGQTLDV
jgi:hypothetical protein